MSHPFFGQEFQFTQPDGSKLRVRGWGDQQNAHFETLDGRPIRQDPITKVFSPVDATTPTPAPAGRVAQPPNVLLTTEVGSQPGLPTSGTRWQQRRAEQRVALAGPPLLAPPQRETVGTFVGLCLLIQFPGVNGSITREEVEAFCNQANYTRFGNHGSVFDYYRDVSGGRVRYTNIVASYYTARNPRTYYTDENVAQPLRAVELITEALDDVIASGLDLSDLSTDARGYVYAVNVFYAGERVNNWGRGLWPHAYHLMTPYRLRNGADAFDYQITDMPAELSLGTFCHENGHMLCDFPDLYDYGGQSSGIGAYCLMCAGGVVDPKNPVHVGGYLKARAGWSDSVTDLTAGRTVTLDSARNEFGLLRKSATEYYIVENRQQAGRDAALPDAGLAIWHVDELGDNSDEQMSPTKHYECSLVQADGKTDLERHANLGNTGDLFRSGVNDTFGPASRPPFTWWDGTPGPIEIAEIGPSGRTMQFLVR
jgi:M6 family metalloprotease-like protein